MPSPCINEYSKLKESVIRAVNKEPEYKVFLTRLKEIFRREINSPRRSEQIRNIDDLLHVLEKRDELAEDNIILLKTIAGALRNGSELEMLITQYNELMLNSTGTSTTSYYDCNPSKPSKAESPLHTSIINEKKRQLIYETIANEIGSHWRDLARNLEIRERQIIEINTNYNDYSGRVTEVLKLSEHKSDPQRWFYQLCEALESARRKDLRRSLQEIIMMNV